MIASLAMALVAASASGAQVPGRQLFLPPTPDFVPAYKAMQGRQSIVEFVPRGQSVRNFTRMITIQTFPVARGTTAGAVLSRFAGGYAARCPGTRAQPVVLGGGATGVRIDCPRHPATGRPETVFARALAMPPEMAIVHVTSKYVVMPGEAAWTRDFIGRVRVR